MQSPYFNGNAAPSFMPPPGLMQALLARDEQMQKDMGSIGRLGGSLTAGIGGAIQGAQNPGVFGAGTSKTSGGFQGFGANFQAGMEAGGGGPTGFAGMLNRGGGSGGGGGGAMNFKQLQELGKSADSFREAMKSGMPTLGDQEPDVFGKDEEWKTLGAREKFQRVQAGIQANAEKSVMQKMALLDQEMKLRQQQMQGTAQIGPFMGEYAKLTSTPEGQPTNYVEQNAPVGMAPNAAFAAAVQKYPLAPGGPQFDNTLQRYMQMGGAGGKQYGDVQFADVPGRPGAKVVMRDGYTSVIQPENKPTPSTKAPTLFDVGGGRQMFQQPNGQWGTMQAPQMPPQVQAQLATLYGQLGGIIAELGDPGLSAKKRAELEKIRDRYAAQVEQIEKGFKGTTGAAPAGGGNPNDPIGLLQ